ncbi:MAG: sn-glycerol-3-phosphate ABC transporter ATP-binding protein UgpC [Gemmatimonadetes bacterium]|nr:sn-glycerol-3-phosphate ABC transporter ATP-binding protein UgpC [Gemmatimonadota bacterium]
MATIRLDGVEKRFSDGTTAVRRLSLEIRDGELFVLLGPSGCGKSTLLNLIVGLETPTSGTVSVDGRSMAGVEPGKRDMAMVFQSYAIYPHMTVRQNLAFPLEVAGVPAEERNRRIVEVAEMLELQDLLDRRPGMLSGGQRQRVAMGRAIVRDPVAFLLDEPLSNLDARLRGQMRIEIARLHRRLGTTTVYVTHDQTEALTLADRMAVMSRGEVQQIGTPREVYDKPANRFIAEFLGTPPMTFMQGKAEGKDLVCPLGRVRRDTPTMLRGPVQVGIRPEDVREVTSTASPPFDAKALRFRARVDLVEWVGSETYAHAVVEAAARPQSGSADPPAGAAALHGDQRIVARLAAGSTAREGDTVELEVDIARLHVFDHATGVRIN